MDELALNLLEEVGRLKTKPGLMVELSGTDLGWQVYHPIAVWCLVPGFPALGKLRENKTLEFILGNILQLCMKQTKQNMG